MTFVCKVTRVAPWHNGSGVRITMAMDRPTTFKEMTKITAGAVTSLVIVGWIVVLAIAFM